MIKTFHPSHSSRFLSLLLLLPATCLLIWVARKLAIQGMYPVSAVVVATGTLLAAFLVFQLTLRVEMDEHSITRSWLFGARTVPVGEISWLSCGEVKGELMLGIRYGKKRYMQLSSNTLTKEDLRGIHKDVLREILAARGLEGEPLWPLYMPYVDFDEMLKRKHS
ncbi:hypothetical protein [Dyella silvatica]|uniref:hypothetical protein n=1 Tax=Dyella silvatica TaxID=2992128 RepID=UPI0022545B9E|nr:hypothetical protein [Dyella silvatica]